MQDAARTHRAKHTLHERKALQAGSVDDVWAQLFPIRQLIGAQRRVSFELLRQLNSLSLSTRIQLMPSQHQIMGVIRSSPRLARAGNTPSLQDRSMSRK